MNGGLESAALNVHWMGLQKGYVGRRGARAPGVRFELAPEGHWEVRVASSALCALPRFLAVLQRVLPADARLHVRASTREPARVELSPRVWCSATVLLAQRLHAAWGESHALHLDAWCGQPALVLTDRPRGVWCPRSRGEELRILASDDAWTVAVERLPPAADADISRALELLAPVSTGASVSVRFAAPWVEAPPPFVRRSRGGRDYFEDARLGVVRGLGDSSLLRFTLVGSDVLALGAPSQESPTFVRLSNGSLAMGGGPSSAELERRLEGVAEGLGLTFLGQRRTEDVRPRSAGGELAPSSPVL